MSDRQRSYTWSDPSALHDAGRDMSGLEYLRAILDGELPHPPICATIGFRFMNFDEGHAVMRFEPGEHHYNPLGTVHGSVTVALLDSVTGCAVHTTLPAGVGYATLSINTTFLRPIEADTGGLLAKGGVLKRGRRVALAEGELVDSGGGALRPRHR